jgi:hypothetical protein
LAAIRVAANGCWGFMGTRFGFRTGTVGAALAAFALVGCNSVSNPIPTQVPTAQSVAGLTPSGKVTMTQVFAGGMGVGTGTLTFNGKTYPFKLLGTVMGPGSVSKISVSGEVYKLDDVSQFSGAWIEGTGAIGLETSQAGDLWLENKAGVIMHLTGTQTGVTLSLGRDELLIKLGTAN